MSVTELHRTGILDAFQPLFSPRSIAVVGASATGTSAGNRFIRLLKSSGFSGKILPIHPKASQIEELPAYSSLEQVPGVVDYAYLTVPADRAEQVLSQAVGKLRFAQVMASGDDESMPQWQARLQRIARDGGFRIIGPNCMGTHSPQGRYTFMEGVELREGHVGTACQSGGLGMDILRRGQNLGLRFRSLVTLGNSIDVEPSDLLEFHLRDPHTQVIGLYVEDVKDGGRFQRLMRSNRGRKPIVLLVGGVTSAGSAAAASHTGALGGTQQAWQALARQTGAILTETLDTFLHALLLCQCLKPSAADGPASVTLFGNGGGTSVLATDALDRAGFTLAVPPQEARNRLEAIALPPGASLRNPIDLPASVLKEEEGRVAARILDIDRRITAPYATLIHLNLPVIMGYRHVTGFLGNLLDAVLGAEGSEEGGPHRLLVLRSDRSEEVDAWRRTFRNAAAERGVATFDEIPEAVDALRFYRCYERFLAATGAAGSPRMAAATATGGIDP